MAEWFVSSAVLAALLIGAHYLLRGKISARLQYALWLVLLVRLLLPLSVGKTALSVANLLPEAEPAAVIQAEPAAVPPAQAARTPEPAAPAAPVQTPVQPVQRPASTLRRRERTAQSRKNLRRNPPFPCGRYSCLYGPPARLCWGCGSYSAISGTVGSCGRAFCARLRRRRAVRLSG